MLSVSASSRPDSDHRSSVTLGVLIRLSGRGRTVSRITLVIFSYSLFKLSSGRWSSAGSRPSRASCASRLANVQLTSPGPVEEVGESPPLFRPADPVDAVASRSAAETEMCRLDLAVARSRRPRTSLGLLNRKTWCSPRMMRKPERRRYVCPGPICFPLRN
jgi:hypothetical protein